MRRVNAPLRWNGDRLFDALDLAFKLSKAEAPK